MNSEFLLGEKHQRGLKDEELFFKDFKHHFPKSVFLRADSYEDNSTKHIDIFITAYTSNNIAKVVSVDVKGKKSIGIKNLKQNEYTVLERKDAYGNDGWMFGGKATHIAFKSEWGWVISQRMKLVEYYINNVKDEWVTDINDCYLKKHQRFNSKEEFTCVNFNDIITFSKLIKFK